MIQQQKKNEKLMIRPCLAKGQEVLDCEEN